ncbi:MAG: glycosyl transferase family 1 [Comamonadaceae bacterium PBBC1]|nr:MAG: glycosyl transferase family 1 [Comamonadaceae bacterium PBBC1]
MNILFLATDAYGGHGGIAYYNRCLAEALVETPGVSKITLLPRLVNQEPVKVPAKVDFIVRAAGSKRRYLQAMADQMFKPCSLVICGHINLLPLATIVSLLKRVPLVLQVHGIDVWKSPHRLNKLCLQRVDAVWSVSKFTLERMNTWAKLPIDRYTIIPNTIHPERYGMAPKREDLLQRYKLQGKKVILTLARLDSRERYKGIDEIMQVLPSLLLEEPSLCYLIAGDGDDRDRLLVKAKELGVSEQVVFAGYVPEAEKADLLRLADVFAMPGRGEGFGIVYLEAMACGVPVVGSLLDGSRDALKNGELGHLVNPDDPVSLQEGLLQALQAHKKIPAKLESFAWPRFAQRVAQVTKSLLAIPRLQ